MMQRFVPLGARASPCSLAASINARAHLYV